MSTVAIETASLISVRTLRWSKLASIIALLGLTPIISHVHLGVIRMTFLFAIIPAFTAWGLGALLVREIARRTQRGWATIVLLGCAVALAEECLFLQTSFFPLIGTDPQHAYGRIAGVNWAYLLWALGYETVWAFVIPIFLIESLFPATRDKPWLGRVGLSLLAILFVGTGFARWYAWTQVFIPENFAAWNQGPARFQVGLAFLIVAATCRSQLWFGGSYPAERSQLPCASSFARCFGARWRHAGVNLVCAAIPCLRSGTRCFDSSCSRCRCGSLRRVLSRDGTLDGKHAMAPSGRVSPRLRGAASQCPVRISHSLWQPSTGRRLRGKNRSQHICVDVRRLAVASRVEEVPSHTRGCVGQCCGPHEGNLIA